MLRATAVLIVVAGLWGALIAYIGPLFGYSMPPGSDKAAFEWTAAHWQLHLVPGIAAIVGGVILFAAGPRALALLGGLLALAGGVWFAIGNEFARAGLLASPGGEGGGGQAEPSTFLQVVTPIGYHDGVGVVLAALAALALGLLASRRLADEEESPVVEPRRERQRERELVRR